MIGPTRAAALFGVLATTIACGRQETARPSPGAAAPRPSILLVTLDTTRADAIGPDAVGVDTPAFDALAARGRRFRRAYATAPETLPSHSSMFTGLYPAGHGVHENGRTLPAGHPVLAEALKRQGYRTAAFVSSFVLARAFGLARGFDVYDDEGGAARNERGARETTDRALSWLQQQDRAPLFVWVHYFDPHAPYDPPEPYRARHAEHPYRGEVAAMDEQLGRLVQAFHRKAGAQGAIVVAGDHGESLGEHGEAQHGRLLYEPAMRVPLVLVGPGVGTGVEDAPVSARRVYHTVLDWAGLPAEHSLRTRSTEVVLGEAMKPFLAYGWQPQVMAVDVRHKAIRSGATEAYDVVADPGERQDLGAAAPLSRELRTALLDYPVPAPGQAPAAATLGEEQRRKLAALGYVGADTPPVVREDAPRAADMRHLFGALDEASDLFVRGDYARVVPVLERILKQDGGNLDAALRLATAHSSLGHTAQAEAAFARAAEIAPQSPDVRVYHALHLARGREWARAVPLLERALTEAPDRLPVLEALATLRERQGRLVDAVALRVRLHALRPPSPDEQVHLGRLAMDTGATATALAAFEDVQRRQGGAFGHDLELGVLYLAASRLEEARQALDRVPPTHPERAMALFKRAQVSVLLGEPEHGERIAAARRAADATTRPLIERERLFTGR